MVSTVRLRVPLQTSALTVNLTSIGAYEGRKLERFFSLRFDDLAGASFPDADLEHLETCINFAFWVFSVRNTLQ